MFGQKIRCEKDSKLYHELLSHKDIQRIHKKITEYEDKTPQTKTKRHLLSTSLKLSKAISPKLHQMTEECTQILGIDLPVNLFVYSGSEFNAACFKPESGELYIIFSSSLLESFNEGEVRYVLGHELGHHLYQHHDIPLGIILNPKNQPTPQMALKLFQWSRYAEISADRAGAACTKNFETVASALFKLSSGVTKSPLVKFNLNEYMKQIDELIHHHNNSLSNHNLQDWFSTHPFSPLRVKALQYFFNSEYITKDGFEKNQLELKVEQTLNVMEQDYLQSKDKSALALRDLFIAVALMIIKSDNKITDDEKSTFNELTNQSLNIEALNLEKLIADLPKRTDKVNQLASFFQKHQLMKDLCLIAQSNKELSHQEMEILYQLGQSLQVNKDFIDKEVHSELKLD